MQESIKITADLITGHLEPCLPSEFMVEAHRIAIFALDYLSGDLLRRALDVSVAIAEFDAEFKQ